jgi:hypothetical protein
LTGIGVENLKTTFASSPSRGTFGDSQVKQVVSQPGGGKSRPRGHKQEAQTRLPAVVTPLQSEAVMLSLSGSGFVVSRSRGMYCVKGSC